MKVWEVGYEVQASNDKDWLDLGGSVVAAKTGELAIEKARKHSLRQTWHECDDNGDETKKKVRAVGFRLTGLKLLQTIDLQ